MPSRCQRWSRRAGRGGRQAVQPGQGLEDRARSGRQRGQHIVDQQGRQRRVGRGAVPADQLGQRGPAAGSQAQCRQIQPGHLMLPPEPGHLSIGEGQLLGVDDHQVGAQGQAGQRRPLGRHAAGRQQGDGRVLQRGAQPVLGRGERRAMLVQAMLKVVDGQHVGRGEAAQPLAQRRQIRRAWPGGRPEPQGDGRGRAGGGDLIQGDAFAAARQPQQQDRPRRRLIADLAVFDQPWSGDRPGFLGSHRQASRP